VAVCNRYRSINSNKARSAQFSLLFDCTSIGALNLTSFSRVADLRTAHSRRTQRNSELDKWEEKMKLARSKKRKKKLRRKSCFDSRSAWHAAIPVGTSTIHSSSSSLAISTFVAIFHSRAKTRGIAIPFSLFRSVSQLTAARFCPDCF